MYHLIVIDDEDSICNVLRCYLEDQGFNISVAHDGKQGLDLVEHDPPDLLITDVFMPEKDGVEVILAMRRKWPAVPIVVISGGSLLGIRDMLYTAKIIGAAHVLRKPFALEELLAAIHDLLPPVLPQTAKVCTA